MKILSLITARGGSKRVPGKNIRLLDGKPLIEWSIDAVKGVHDICDILVSTDDSKTAEIARSAGALVPWLRPAQLSTDESTSVDVALHALDWYESKNGKVDGLLLLQPTSPFRTRRTIDRGIKIYKEHHSSVIAMSPAQSHPMWCYQINRNVMTPFVESEHMRSQDLPPAYVMNGSLYLISADELRKKGSFYNNDTHPLIVENPAECIDIDTEWDWKIAEAIVLLQNNSLCE